MERIDAVQLAEDTVLVTGVASIHRMEFSNRDGDELQAPVIMGQSALQHQIRLLSDILRVTPGPGVYSSKEIAELIGADQISMSGIIRNIAKHAPPGIIAYHAATREQRGAVEVGQFAVAGRQATEYELSHKQAGIDAINHQKLDLKRAALLERESFKTDLSRYDHSQFVIGGLPYYVSLESSSGIIMARTLTAIGKKRPGVMLDPKNLASVVWDAMPLAERQLMTASERALYGSPPSKIREAILDIIGRPTLALGLSVRAPWGARSATPITTDHNAEPPTAPFLEQATPIFPPGTPVADTLSIRGSEITDEDRQLAEQVLMTIRHKRVVSHPEALELLGMIMDTGCKQAIASILDSNRRAFTDTVAAAHDIARRSLRDGYWTVRRDWEIGNHSRTTKLYRARHVSGDLPVDTNIRGIKHTKETVTRRWTIGYKTTLAV